MPDEHDPAKAEAKAQAERERVMAEHGHRKVLDHLAGGRDWQIVCECGWLAIGLPYAVPPNWNAHINLMHHRRIEAETAETREDWMWWDNKVQPGGNDHYETT